MEEGDILFFISALIAEIIGTMAGFGSSTIFLPLAMQFVDFKTAIILVAIFHLFGNLGRITFFRQGFDKRIILLFGVPSVLLSLLGAFPIEVLPQPFLKLILGIFLIVISVDLVIFWLQSSPPSILSATIGFAMIAARASWRRVTEDIPARAPLLVFRCA